MGQGPPEVGQLKGVEIQLPLQKNVSTCKSKVFIFFPESEGKCEVKELLIPLVGLSIKSWAIPANLKIQLFQCLKQWLLLPPLHF